MKQETTFRRGKSSPRVDYHCHISMKEYADIDHPTIVTVSKEEFISDLDAAGFDKAVVLSDSRTTPERVAEFVKQAPDRFIGFGYVNPVRRDAAESVLEQKDELGLFGLKLYPTTDGYRPDDYRAFKTYEAAVSLDMPIMLHHAGMPEPHDLLKHSDPAQIDAVASCFPKLRIILAHLGYPRVDETLYVLRKHKNVWADVSWPYGDVNHPSYRFMLWRDLLTALNLGVMDKLVFGTDYPGVRQKFYKELLVSVNKYAPHEDLKIPKEKLEAITSDNIKPLLP
ncbi:amidohydrolase [Candidatus Bathyarchaeota archaeon]|nr:amidohydrolase [Candidatus Bathyarchaeota archaeon]